MRLRHVGAVAGRRQVRLGAVLAGQLGAHLEVVAVQADRLTQAMRDCGCTLNNAYMQHSLLALVVIPALRISDLGLVDVTRFEPTDLLLADG